MANNVKRLIKEEGIVLEKIFKAATDEFKGRDGNLVKAQPDRWALKVCSSSSYDKNLGFVDSTILDYPVSEDIYNKVAAYNKVFVLFELSNYGPKPQSIELKEVK